MKSLIVLAGVAILASSAAAQQKADDLNFVLGLSEYREFRNTLKTYLHGRALELLRERKQSVTNTADRKKLLRAKMTEALGGFPERTPLKPQIVAAIERDGYRIEKILFKSQPRLYVTAN